jgi:hypothetical protein
VVYYQESRGRGGQLLYLPGSLDDDSAPREAKEIARPTLTEDLDEVRATVDRLTGLAILGRERGEIGIETVARRLATHVLPPGLIERFMGATFHPRFDISPDLAAGIPWEVLESPAPACGCPPPPRAPLPTGSPCPKCGQTVETRFCPLALTYHLTHLVPGNSSARRGGRTFLIVHDPTGDLSERDTTPDRVCATHVEILATLIRNAGFEVDLLAGPLATRARFRKALEQTDLAGLYFFGHGCFPREGDEGFLRLADGELVASAFEEMDLAIPFVFLNACEGAAAARDWDLDRRQRNVACAFARGPGRAVIAPLWPVVNVQAAQTALEVFRHAFESRPLAEALHHARIASHAAYVAGAPHLAWMSYRYLGNPNHTLIPQTTPTTLAPAPDSAPAPESRSFDRTGPLDAESFAFNLEGVLLCAANRRNRQHRRLATTTDILAGLIRKGDLTRCVLAGLGCDPDLLYDHVIDAVETDPPNTPPRPSPSPASPDLPTTAQAAVLPLRDAEQFTPAAWRILIQAGANRAKEGGARSRISERDVLDLLLQEPIWGEPPGLGLPPSVRVTEHLREKLDAGQVDVNGAVPLGSLDPAAREIVEIAHRLARHRGLFPIPHRLVLAAMLCQNGGFAPKVCQRFGGDPEALLLLMLALTQSESESPDEPSGLVFGLTPEACARIVSPTLIEAARATPGGDLVTDAALVRAFCKVADPNFKEAIRSVLPAVDLDKWSRVSSSILDLAETLDAPGWKVIETAAELARNAGLASIPNRLVLAAFLDRPDAPAARALCPSEAFRTTLYTALVQSLPRQPGGPLPLDDLTCARVIQPMLEKARTDPQDETVEEWPLFRAFCAVAEPQLKAALRQPPWNLNLDCLPANPPSSAAPATREASSPNTPPTPPTAPAKAASAPTGIPLRPMPTGYPSPPIAPDAGAAALLDAAARLALDQASPAVRTPHLWAALLADEDSPLGRVLRRHSVAPDQVRQLVLRLTEPVGGVPTTPATSLPGLGSNVIQTLAQAQGLAHRSGRPALTRDDILHALLADSGHVVNTLLRQLGIDLTPLASELARVPPRHGTLPTLGEWSKN